MSAIHMHEQKVVPIELVIECGSTSYGVRAMERTLQKQGQIEPLQVRLIPSLSEPDKYMPYEQDTWGNEIVVAARHLGWKTLLVLVTDRYIR